MKHPILKTLLLLIAALTAGIRAEPLFTHAPGMVSYTYREPFAKDLPGTLDTIKALGITDMEFSNLFGKTAAQIR
ncbi:MAG: hypothetical protein RLZZ214_1863, partial [Verrucomicrobiota bacterium]